MNSARTCYCFTKYRLVEGLFRDLPSSPYYHAAGAISSPIGVSLHSGEVRIANVDGTRTGRTTSFLMIVAVLVLTECLPEMSS